jgi:hypothetical protein
MTSPSTGASDARPFVRWGASPGRRCAVVAARVEESKETLKVAYFK